MYFSNFLILDLTEFRASTLTANLACSIEIGKIENTTVSKTFSRSKPPEPIIDVPLCIAENLSRSACE